jgi:nitroreductase
MKKQLFASVLAFCLVAVIAHGQRSTGVSDLILNSYSARTFTSVPVSDGDLEIILKCGIKAPSARNLQPWKFIVTRDLSVMQQMVSNITQGNVLIVICGPEGQANATVDFDCGLATENMTVAAQGLGLGARIYTGPVANINSSMKQTLQIPAGWRAVAVLRVGHIESNVDAASAASPRNSYEEVVTFLK